MRFAVYTIREETMDFLNNWVVQGLLIVILIALLVWWFKFRPQY